jgi:hypothetical protein
LAHQQKAVSKQPRYLEAYFRLKAPDRKADFARIVLGAAPAKISTRTKKQSGAAAANLAYP